MVCLKIFIVQISVNNYKNNWNEKLTPIQPKTISIEFSKNQKKKKKKKGTSGQFSLIFLVFLSVYQSTKYLIFFNIEVLYDMLSKHLNSAVTKLFFGRNPKSPKISHFSEF